MHPPPLFPRLSIRRSLVLGHAPNGSAKNTNTFRHFLALITDINLLLLRNPKVHYRKHKGPLLRPFLSQLICPSLIPLQPHMTQGSVLPRNFLIKIFRAFLLCSLVCVADILHYLVTLNLINDSDISEAPYVQASNLVSVTTRGKTKWFPPSSVYYSECGTAFTNHVTQPVKRVQRTNRVSALTGQTDSLYESTSAHVLFTDT